MNEIYKNMNPQVAVDKNPIIIDKKKKIKKILIIVLVVIGVLAGLYFLLFPKKSIIIKISPKDAVLNINKQETQNKISLGDSAYYKTNQKNNENIVEISNENYIPFAKIVNENNSYIPEIINIKLIEAEQVNRPASESGGVDNINFPFIDFNNNKLFYFDSSFKDFREFDFNSDDYENNLRILLDIHEWEFANYIYKIYWFDEYKHVIVQTIKDGMVRFWKISLYDGSKVDLNSIVNNITEAIMSGNNLWCIANNNSQKSIYQINLNNNSQEKIIDIDAYSNNISISSDNKNISYVNYNKNGVFVDIYNVDSKQKIEKKISDFNDILEISNWSYNGSAFLYYSSYNAGIINISGQVKLLPEYNFIKTIWFNSKNHFIGFYTKKSIPDIIYMSSFDNNGKEIKFYGNLSSLPKNEFIDNDDKNLLLYLEGLIYQVIL